MKTVTHNAFVAAGVIGKTKAPATISEIRNAQAKTEKWERINVFLENFQKGIWNQERQMAIQK
jgi:hypothetical protein